MPDGLGPPFAEPLFQRLALIGMGLMGSSIAHVVRRKELAREIIVADSSASVRARASELALASRIVETAGDAVKGADLVIICVPV
ncbi:MAG: NAD(P)-binding domain-containing protein, partial [Beijerinckiaceae bacterium]|nr:NAD(P)-binding domain-containing protein [Beijerinckiaceae bacterium]